MNRPKTAAADLTMTKELRYLLVHKKNSMSGKKIYRPKTAAAVLSMTKQ